MADRSAHQVTSSEEHKLDTTHAHGEEPRGKEMDTGEPRGETPSMIRPFDRSDSDRVYQFANNPSHPSQTSTSQKVKQAIDTIESAIHQFGVKGLAISFNGGKDSTVLIHLFAAVLYHGTRTSTNTSGGLSSEDYDDDDEILGVYFRCQSPFPEVDRFIEACKLRYRIQLVIVDDHMKKGLGEFLDTRPTIQAILIGTRDSDPNGARLCEFDPTDHDWPSIIRVHPILRWSYDDVWHFLRHLEIDWCPLYNDGYTSLGSSFNTYRNPHLQRQDGQPGWLPAWELHDGQLERAGRTK